LPLKKECIYIFERIKKYLKGGGEAAFESEQGSALGLWCEMYENRAPWLDSRTKSLNLAAAVASEYARLVTLELKTELTGSARAEYLNAPYGDLVRRLRKSVEYGCAKGGLIFKPFVSRNGMHVECIQADAFVPTEFDSSGRLMGAVFAEQIRRGKLTYTRLEQHGFEEGRYVIRNKAFVCGRAGTGLGSELPLTDVPEWSLLLAELWLDGVERPLFAYFTPSSGNQEENRSPLGVSVFSKAVDLIKDADVQYSRLLWEFEGSELAVDAASDVLKPMGEGSRLPKRSERLFRRLETADPDFYRVFSPAIRDQSIINGLNTILRRIEFNCGLAYGTLSDVRTVQRTAQEILDSRQRSYASICDCQRALRFALEDLICAMDTLATLYRLAPEGRVEAGFDFDDSIVTDRGTQFEERLKLVQNGILAPEELKAWYLGKE
jgi:A118 family predicted phage portal protein